LRERDIDDFATELGQLARRNPGVFLAGSVALGFGIARFFKARSPQARGPGDASWRTGTPRSDVDERYDMDSDESVDLSDHGLATSPHSGVDTGLDTDSADARTDRPAWSGAGTTSTAGGPSTGGGSSTMSGSSTPSGSATTVGASGLGSSLSGKSPSGSETTDEGRGQNKSRTGTKSSKGKGQRASTSEHQPATEEPYPAPLGTGTTAGSGTGSESAFTGGVGSGALRGGKDS
jgi:hypothetical protein